MPILNQQTPTLNKKKYPHPHLFITISKVYNKAGQQNVEFGGKPIFSSQISGGGGVYLVH